MIVVTLKKSEIIYLPLEIQLCHYMYPQFLKAKSVKPKFLYIPAT